MHRDADGIKTHLEVLTPRAAGIGIRQQQMDFAFVID
jgi:hypothetical protein